MQQRVMAVDTGLPGEDGYELIGKVRALEAEKGGRIPAKPVVPAELVAQAALLAGPRGGP